MSTGKVALLTGVTGHDSAQLAELLLSKNYEVHGIKRRSNPFITNRIDRLYQDPLETGRKFISLYGDLTDSSSPLSIVKQMQPDEIYNLAAQAHVAVSFEEYEYTANADGIGAPRLLEAIQICLPEEKPASRKPAALSCMSWCKKFPIRPPLPFYPRSTTAVAKMDTYWISVYHRKASGTYSCNGLQFNHESTLRGETFIPTHITPAFSPIALGLQDSPYLGQMSPLRNYARNCIEIQSLMPHQHHAGDSDISAGVQCSLRQFVQFSTAELGITIEFNGSDTKRIATVTVANPVNREYKARFIPDDAIVKVDPCYYRPTVVETLPGYTTRAKQKLDWAPRQHWQKSKKCLPLTTRRPGRTAWLN